jgi:hypothetical protein
VADFDEHTADQHQDHRRRFAQRRTQASFASAARRPAAEAARRRTSLQHPKAGLAGRPVEPAVVAARAAAAFRRLLAVRARAAAPAPGTGGLAEVTPLPPRRGAGTAQQRHPADPERPR